MNEMNEYMASDDARSSTKMLGGTILLFLIVSIFATGYFGGRALYFMGYNKGYEAKVCNEATCMSYVVDAEQKCMKRWGR
jgi:hypothetical protein